MAVGTRTYTVEEFDRFVERPENADKLFEYIGGEFVEVPSNPYSSHIAMRVVRHLAAWVEDHDLGYVTGEAGGYRVSGERYAPDVAFLRKDKGPLAEDGYHPTAPDLAVEVLSPTDKASKVLTKVVNYMAAGTVVWVIDPETKEVRIYVPGQREITLRTNDTLDGGAVLPGFLLAIKEIFPEEK